MIVADPIATAVTSPSDETVTTDSADETHVTTESGTMFPPESFTVATIVAVSSSEKKESEVGDTSTVIVSSPTVTEADPLAEPEVAIIEIDPVATGVTKPADETVATAVFVDDHVTVGLAIVLSFASFTVATSVAVSANEEKLRLVGDRVTDDAT